MNNKYTLTKSEIEKLASLSNLHLSSEEEMRYIKQIDETIHYIENLSELDTSNVDTTNNAVHTNNVFFEDGTESLRTLSSDASLQNAKRKRDKYFIVDNVSKING